MKRKKNLSSEEKNLMETVSSSSYSPIDVESWRLFYNKYNPRNYSYFTEMKDSKKNRTYTYPAKFRWIPIQRKNLNVLISTQQLRPFIYDLSVSDNAGINRKFYARAMGMVDFIFNQHKQFHEQYVLALQQLGQQKQQMEQMLQQEPRNEQEAIQQQQLRQQMPSINSQFEILQSNIRNKQVLPRRKMEQAERFFLSDAKDIVEEVGQKISLKIKKSNSFKQESDALFTSTLVTGKGFYYVNHDRGNKNVTIKAVSEMDVIYPMISSIKWTHELPWIGLKERWSVSDIIRVYGDQLTAVEIKNLEDGKMNSNSEHPVFLSTANESDGSAGGAMLIKDSRFGYAGTYEDESVEVLRVWYIKERKIQARITPNKYNLARPHIHFVDDENLKRTPIRKDRGEKLETRYVSERYYGITINGTIHLGYELDELQPRDSNNLSKVYLPIIGKTHSNINDQPYSLIQETKDLAELYQVINYHRELYIAVSGVKGQIVDTSQKPSDMSLAEQRYFKKLGMMYIQTKTKGGRNIGSNYNQWKGYDDSISPAINQLDNMLYSIDESLGILMGVPRQRVGQTVSTDQVGSNEQAVHMANLVTEKLHYEHDVINAKALEMAINIHLNYLLKPGDIMSVPMGEGGLGQELYKVPPIDTKNSQISIDIENNGKELQLKKELKAAAQAGYGRGELPFNALMKIYTIDSVKKLEKTLLYLDEKANEARSQSVQAEKQAEQEKDKWKFEADMALKQEEIKAKMAELEFNKLKLQVQDATENKKIDSEMQLKLLEIGSERETEATYLQEQNRASTIDEQLRLLEIQLNNLQQQQQLRLSEKQGDQKHVESMKKTKDQSSTKGQNKEKIKDK